MLRLCAYTVALMLTFVSCAYGQSPATTTQKEVAVSEPKNKAPEPRPNDLQSEVESLKAENAAVRELLRKMEEQQKLLLEQVDRLQRRFDGAAPPPQLAEAAAPLPGVLAEANSETASAVYGEFRDSHEYAGGIKWHFLPTERLWLNAEIMRVMRVPYSGGFTPYTAGWVPMVQTVLAF